MELQQNLATKGRSTVTLFIGLAILAVGVWASWIQINKAHYVITSLGAPDSPYTRESGILAALWVTTAVFLALAGLSLVISAMRRRRSNLIPGPTLYILGLSIIGIGIFMLMYGQTLYGIGAIALGLILAWWELAFDIS